jgi:hypothetical protein
MKTRMRTGTDVPPPNTDVGLVDEADEFEDELAAEMLRTGAIEVWG